MAPIKPDWNLLLILLLLNVHVSAQTTSSAAEPSAEPAKPEDGDCSYDGSVGEYIACQKARFSTTTLVAVGLGIIFGLFFLAGGIVWFFKQRRKGTGEPWRSGTRQGGRGGKLARAKDLEGGRRDAGSEERGDSSDEEGRDEKWEVKKPAPVYQPPVKAEVRGAAEQMARGKQQPGIEHVNEDSGESNSDLASSEDEAPRSRTHKSAGPTPQQNRPTRREGQDPKAARVESATDTSDESSDEDSDESDDDDSTQDPPSSRPGEVAAAKAKEIGAAIPKPIPAVTPPSRAETGKAGSPTSAIPSRSLTIANPSPHPRHLASSARTTPTIQPPMPPPSSAAAIPPIALGALPQPPSSTPSTGHTKPLSIRKSSGAALASAMKSGSPPRPNPRATARFPEGQGEAKPPKPDFLTGRRPSEGPRGEIRRPSPAGSAAMRASAAASSRQQRPSTGRRPSERGNMI